jgi:hypothetical protein
MKEKLIALIKSILDQKIRDLEIVIAETQKSANEETKSSMGDKYETGRAMAQNSIAILQNQLLNFKAEKNSFDLIDFSSAHQTVRNGSLVKTSIGYLFVGVSLGRLTVENTPIMTLSQDSPLGKEIWSKSIAYKGSINKNLIAIEDIL